jgi:HAE1 family hydrophobic/amphiphilic exporter-1
MGLIRFAIENPVKVAVAVILTVMFGMLAVFSIPIQLTPNVDKPIIKVATTWSGASPQEIESEIVDRQEEKLKNVNDLEKMTSSATEGMATVALEFPVGVDKDVAYRNVSDRLRQVTGYPEEVDEPTISETDDDMEAVIAWMMVKAEDGSSVAHMKTFIEEKVKPILERAEGVAEVPVYGGLEREMQVQVDPQRLAAFGLTFMEVGTALRRQNRNYSAGTVSQGKRDFVYRAVGEFRSVEEIESTVVAYPQGGPVFVRDVAEVVDGFKKPFSFVRSTGQYVLAMPARRAAGSNVIRTMQNLQDKIDEVNRDLLNPRGMYIEQVYDETVYIWSAIWLVIKNIFVGGVLAVIVLVLFLRSGSATGIVAVAIPISVIGTFLVVTMLGRNLNVIMLAGMAFAVGMVVDNAIVVLENVYRHRSMGKTKLAAAMDGTSEVWGAILASTLTTMAVFLPVITIQEEAGQLFKDIAIAIASAVGLSLLVSVFVIPPLASRFFSAGSATKIADQAGDDKPWWFGVKVASLVGVLDRHWSLRLGAVAVISAAAIGGSILLAPPTEYLPPGNQNLIFGFLISPPGYSIDEYRRMGKLVEEGDPADPLDGIRPSWETELADADRLRPVMIPVGSKGELKEVQPPPIDNFFFVSFGGMAFMGANSKEPTRVKPVEYVLQEAGSRVPGVFAVFSQASIFGRDLSGGGNAITIEIRSDDEEALAGAASAIQQAVMGAGYGYPRADPSNFDLGQPEVQLVLNRAKAADVGLTAEDVGFILRCCVDGAFVGEYNDRGDKIDLAVKTLGPPPASVQELAKLEIFTPRGDRVPLETVVDLVSTTSPQQINHIEEMNSISVSVIPKLGVPLQETMRELQEGVIQPLRAAGAVPPTVLVSLAGTADKLTQTQQALIGNFDQGFDGVKPFGLSGSAVASLLAMVVLAVAVGLGMIFGVRTAILWTLGGLAVVVVLFFALHPQLVLTLFESRAILALLVVYLLMAALFESFAYPFVIMFSVPLAMVGGFAALAVVHWVSLHDVSTPIQQLDVLTMLGFVILVGIVVNNAILLVHQALTFMRRDGLETHQAVMRSVQTRTRPIFMSALTSIMGMTPLVVMPGAGSELYRGLGSVVLGGLLVSTVFTLVVVPLVFLLFLDVHAWLAAAMASGKQAAASMVAGAPAQMASAPAASNAPRSAGSAEPAGGTSS